MEEQMKKNLKWLLCLLSTIAIMFTGCASGGSDSESAECEVGKIYAEKENFITATDFIKKAIELEPNNYDYYIDLGQYQRYQGQGSRFHLLLRGQCSSC